MLRHWKRFTRSWALCVLLAGCVTIPRSCPPPKVVNWEDLRVYAANSQAAALIGSKDRIAVTDARFNQMLCFDSDDFELFYLNHVLGIDGRKAVDKE